MTKKTRGGRPPRVLGETSVRVSAAIRPRYKELIERIAKDREVTVSDAIELAIIKYAETTPIISKKSGPGGLPSGPFGKLKNKNYIDLVRPPYESLYRIYDAIDLSAYFVPTAPGDLRERARGIGRFGRPLTPEEMEGTTIVSDLYATWFQELREWHQDSFLKIERFSGVMRNIENRIALYRFFDPKKLSAALSLDWMEDLPIAKTVNNILMVCLFVVSSLAVAKRKILTDDFFQMINTIKHKNISYEELQRTLSILGYSGMMLAPDRDHVINKVFSDLSVLIDTDVLQFYEVLQFNSEQPPSDLSAVSCARVQLGERDSESRQFKRIDVIEHLISLCDNNKDSPLTENLDHDS